MTLTIFCGCETKNAEINPTEVLINGRTIKIYVIDNCEYIGSVQGNNGDILTHKGNCKFCAKRNEKHGQ